MAESSDQVRVYAGIGGNVGNPARTMCKAARTLDGEEGIEVVAGSPMYRNPPIGPQDQPHFLNAVLALSVTLTPEALLDRFLAVERDFGRVRDIPWGPRTLDLDILTYGDHVIDVPGLTIPHAHMLKRSFVMIPLADLRPDDCHPTEGKSYRDLAATVGREDLERVDVSLF